MAIRTQESISGFIASDPQLTTTERGEARFFARFGQEHFHREDDGTFTKLEPTFGNLVLYRTTAERAYAQFAKGDQFVAEGYVHSYDFERDGQTVASEEFIAKKIGHDTVRTHYSVDRSPRGPGDAAASRRRNRAFECPQQRPAADAPIVGR